MTVLLVLVCAALVWLAASSFWSIAFPERRTYPADRREGLVFRFNSLMGPGASIGLFIVSVGGWNSLVLDGWLRFGVGSVLLALGVYFSLGGVFKLGMDRTHGIAGELLEDGPYRFTRNPQYVGSLMATRASACSARRRLALPLPRCPRPGFSRCPLPRSLGCERSSALLTRPICSACRGICPFPESGLANPDSRFRRFATRAAASDYPAAREPQAAPIEMLRAY